MACLAAMIMNSWGDLQVLFVSLTNIYVTGPHLVGWHRYTRWTGRLSHHASNLSCPHNLLPKGCDPCFARYQVLGEKVVVLLGHHQINKVVITQSPPNRSGCMLLVNTNNTVLLRYASYSRGTKTAKVGGLWLCRDPKTCAWTPRWQ